MNFFFGIKSFLKSLQYALKGIWHGLQNEKNFRIQSLIAVMVVVLSIVLQINVLKWCLLLICIALVLGAELLNSAIEKWVDLVKPEFDPKAGLIKDMAAGAVLIISIFAAMVGLLIFIPELL